MLKIRFFFSVLIAVYSYDAMCQRQTAKKIIPDSLITLQKGIYMNIGEFLRNEPSIPFQFEKINNNSQTYYIYPEENNNYYFTYYDFIGKKVTMSINDIWGYYDGLGIFLSYKGKPYELVYLGTFSILRYHKHYHKSMVSQAFSLYTFGSTTTSIEKTHDVIFDLENDTIVSGSRRDFKRLILKDIELYNEYINDKKTPKLIKTAIYIEKYNKKHPIKLVKEGIELSGI